MTDARTVTDGEPRWTRWWWQHTEAGDTAVCIADINDDKTREAGLFERATRDPLTGLVNRSQFLALLTHALHHRPRRGRATAVIFVDLDHFKEINDLAGHLAGDRVLAAVADRIRRAVRPSDIVARTGGDEFAIVCDDIGDAQEPRSVANRVLDALVEPFAAGTHKINASVGVAVTDTPADAEALLAAADKDMYLTKRRRAATQALNTDDEPEPRQSPAEPALIAFSDLVIRQVHSAGLELQACAAMIDGPALAPLRRGLKQLDQLIGEARAIAFDYQLRDVRHTKPSQPDTVGPAARRFAAPPQPSAAGVDTIAYRDDDRQRLITPAAPPGTARCASAEYAVTAAGDADTVTPPDRGPSRTGAAFERGLAASRGLVLIPVMVLMLAALGAFVYGTDVFVNSARDVIEHPLPVGDNIGVFLVVIDLFLIGATMLIAAIGFYELFVSHVDTGATPQLPRWLEMRDLNDLKARVISMIVLVVAVSFAELVVDIASGRQVLEFGAGVAMVVVALTAYVRFSGHGPQSD